MNTEYYNQNFDFLLSTANVVVNGFYKNLNENIDHYISNYCVNDKDIKDYYLDQFNEVKRVIQNEFAQEFNSKYLIDFTFDNDGIKVNKSSFKKFAKNYLNIPDYTIVELVIDEIWNDSFKKNTDVELTAKEVQKIFDEVKMQNAELILKLSMYLKYFKHLLNDHKENESDTLKLKGLPSFGLYQRYLVLTETTDIASDIINLNTSTVRSKHKLLAILLNCSIDNAKQLLADDYERKIKHLEDKKDEVNEFIHNLKIKK